MFQVGGGGPLSPFSYSLEGSRAILEPYVKKIRNRELQICHLRSLSRLLLSLRRSRQALGRRTSKGPVLSQTSR